MGERQTEDLGLGICLFIAHTALPSLSSAFAPKGSAIGGGPRTHERPQTAQTKSPWDRLPLARAAAQPLVGLPPHTRHLSRCMLQLYRSLYSPLCRQMADRMRQPFFKRKQGITQSPSWQSATRRVADKLLWRTPVANRSLASAEAPWFRFGSRPAPPLSASPPSRPPCSPLELFPNWAQGSLQA